MGSETIRNRQYGADCQTSRKEMTRVLKPFDLQALSIFLCIKVALVTELGCGTGDMWVNQEETIGRCSRFVLSDLSAGMLDKAKETLHNFPGSE